MADNQGLDLGLLDDMWDNLDKVYRKLIEVEGVLDRLNTKQIKFAFEGNIRKMTDDLEKLNLALGRISDRGAGKGLGAIFKVIEQVNSISITRSKLNVLSYFAEVMSEFRESISGGSFRSTLVTIISIQAIFKPLFSIFKSIAEIGSGLTTGKLDKVNDLLQTFKETVSSLATIVTEMNNISWGKGSSAFKSATETLTQLVKLFKEIVEVGATSTVGKLEQTGTLLRQMVDFIRNLQALILGMTSTSGIDSAPKLIIGYIAINKILIPLVDSVGRIVKALSGFSPAALKSVAGIWEAMGVFYKEATNLLVLGTAVVSSIGIFRSFIIFTVVIRQLMKPVLKTIGLLVRLDQRELASVARIFDGIGKMYASILDMLRLFTSAGFNVLSAIATGFKTWIVMIPFIRVFEKVIKAAKDVNASQISAIGELFHGMGIAFEGMSALLRNVAKEGVKSSIINSLVLQFISLPPLFNIIKKVTKATSGISESQMKGMAEILTGIGTVMRPLAQFSRDVRRVTGLEDLISQFFAIRNIFGAFAGLIKNIVKATKEIKGKQNLDGFGSILDSIGRLLKEFGILSQSDSLDKKAINAFKDFFETIPKVLNKVKLDPSAAQGLESFLKILVRLVDDANISKDQVNGIKGLAEALVTLGEADFDSMGDVQKVEILLESLSKYLGDLDASKLSDLALIAKNLKQIGKVTKELTGIREDGNKVLDKERVNQAATVIVLNKVRNTVINVAKVFGGLGKAALFAYQNLSPKGILKNLVRGLAAAGDAIREIGEQLRDFGEEVKDFGSELIENFGIGKIFESQAFQDTVGFDKTGKLLQVFGGLTDEARESAEAFAFEIGKQYPLSANDALNATLDLIKAGQDLASVEFILPAAADLAALSDEGNLEAITATLIAAEGIFTQFDNETAGSFENISRVADIIAAAADVSTASVESLSAGLIAAGPAANAFGLTLQETAGILAIFNDAGLSAAQGGTALRSLLNSLEKPSTIAALADLNISLFDPETGGRRPINEIINDIGASLDAMPPAERAAVLQTLADTFGRQGLNILLGAGSDAIDDVVASMEGVAPASERAADSLDNLAGDMIQLQGSTETLMTAALLPLLEDFFRPLVKVARFIVDGLLSLDRQVIRFIGTAIVLTSTIATLVGAALVFLGVLLQVGGGLITVIGFALNFINIIIALVGGVTAITAGFVFLASALIIVIPILAGVTAAFISIVEIFRGDLGGARTSLSNLVSTIGGFAGAIAGFVSSLGSLFKIIAFGAGAVGSDGGSPLVVIGEGIANFLDSITASISRFQNVADSLTGATALFNGLGQLFDLAPQVSGLSSEINVLEAVGLSGATSELEEQRDELASIQSSILATFLINSGLINRVLEDFGGGDALAGVDILIDEFINLGVIFDETINASIMGFVNNVRIWGFSFEDAFSLMLTQLDEGAGLLVSQSIGLFARIFGIDSPLIDGAINAAGNGFSQLGDFVIDTLVSSLKNAVIANRGLLKTIFVKLFQFFFSPLKAVKFFANLFGIKPLQQFIGGFETLLTGLVGGLFDTFVNVLEGQSIGEALLNAFGEGAEPVVRLLTTLGETIGLFFTFIGDTLTKFTADFGENVSIGGIFNAIVGSLADGLQLLNDLVLTPLSEGRFFDILLNVGSFLGGIFTNFFNTIKAVLSSIDFGAIFGGIGQFIVDAVISGISTAFLLLESVASIDFSVLATLFSDALELAFDFADDIGQTVADAVIGSIGVAFSGLTDLTGIDFTTLETLVSDKLKSAFDTIGTILTGDEDRASLFENIVTTINNLAGAFSNLFSVFSTEAESVDEESMEGIQTFLGFIAGLSLDALLVPLRLLDKLFLNLSELNGEELTVTAGAIATIFGAVALLANATAITGVLSSIALFISGLSFGTVSLLPLLAGGIGAISTAFSAFAASAAGSVAGFAAILLILNAIVENVDEFMDIIDAIVEGNIGEALIQAIDALVSFFASIAFTLFDVLGMGDFIGQTQEEFMAMIRGVGVLFIRVIREGGQALLDFLSIGIQEFITSILVGIVEGIGGIDILGNQLISDDQINDMADSFGGGLRKARVAIEAEGGIDLSALFVSGASQGNLEALARQNANLFRQTIADTLSTSENPLETLFLDVDLAQAISLSIDSGIGNEVVADLVDRFGAMDTITFLQTTIVPQLDAEGFGDFTNLIQDLINQGVLTTDQAITMFSDVAFVTDDEQVRDAANRKVVELEATIEATTQDEPVETTIETEVTLDVTNSEESALEAREQVQADLDTLAEETATEPIELGAGINLDPTQAQTPEQVNEYAASITNLRSQVGLLATELSVYPEISAPGFESLTMLLGLITNIGMQTIILVGAIGALSIAMILFGTVATVSFFRAGSAAERFFNYLANAIQTTINGLNIAKAVVDQLGFALQNALKAVSDVSGAIEGANAAAGGNPEAGTGGGAGATQNNAIGGEIGSGERSTVAERGDPEVFTSGNKMYLLTGAKGGKVEPLNNVFPNLSLAGGQRANANLAGAGAGGGVTNNASSVTIQQGDIVIQVAGTNASAAAIANQTSIAVSTANEESGATVNEELRRNFR